MTSCRCIIRLGTSGTISGFDVDTTHFNGAGKPYISFVLIADWDAGNEAPEVSVQILNGPVDQPPTEKDPRVRTEI